MREVTPKPHVLTPPLPNEQVGWGRLRYIIREHSTSSLELKLGFGSFWRGFWTILWSDSTHPFVWTGTISLRGWGVIVLVLGAAQFFACLYKYGRLRSAVATLLATSLSYITMKYLLYYPPDVAVVLYGTLLVGEIWIAYRGWPILGGRPLNGQDK